MFAKPSTTIGDWTGPATAAFEYWISLWPVAPLFGVEWRFADTVVRWNPMTGVTAGPAAEAAAAPVTEAEPVIEVAPVAEPVVAMAVESAPADEPTEPTVPASLMVEAPRDADDLTAIRGIGPGLARQLNGLGVYKFSQLAAFSEEDLAWVDANLSSFKGRCFRDDWTGQAKVLLG
jgi:predicted flap endonuclease-1-like 5' DNA nuclease